MAIHPSAIISPKAEIASDVEIGPFSLVRGRAQIGRGTKIDSHVSIGHENSEVIIGENNQILSNAVVGGLPQDLTYKGEATKIFIGDNNIIREFTTLNCGTLKGDGATRIGSHCMFMAYVHVAHDCVIGNNVILANMAQLAGHVEIGDFARVGGMVGVAQFSRIGRYAYIGGGSNINKDILPYSIAEGNWARARATNKVGLTRAGFKKEEVDNIYRAIRFLIMGQRTIDEALQKIKEECQPSDHIQHIVEFVKSSEAGVAR